MENATKALVMAAGVLLALLILGAFMLMINQVSEYQKTNYMSETDEQLAKFNLEYIAYERDDLKGNDIITLIQKAHDYNLRQPQIGEITYKKITISVDINNINFGGTSPLFGNKRSYTGEEFISVISPALSAQQKYGLSTMNKISSNYEKIFESENTSEQQKVLKEVTGRDITIGTGTGQISKNTINQYRDFTTFKSATFMCLDNIRYEDGQIVEMNFKAI